MNSSVLNTLSIVFLVIAILLILVSVFLFFFLDVHNAIDQLTGKKAEKQISEIRKRSRSGERYKRESRVGKSSNVNVHSESRMSPVSSVPMTENTVADSLEDETTVLIMNDNSEEATTLLSEEATTLLSEEATTLLTEEGTTLLTEEGTTLLSDTEQDTVAEIEILDDEIVTDSVNYI